MSHGVVAVREAFLNVTTLVCVGEYAQIEFGQALGVGQNIVSRYERGRVRPPLDYLVAVARHAKVTLDWLILGEKPAFQSEEVGRDI
jgi:transcriptional regulator with XRE-family HTH domain